MTQTTRDIGKIETDRYAVGPSGREYRLWGGGDGVRVTQEGRTVYDAGSHVECIPLIDVPIIAKLLEEFHNA